MWRWWAVPASAIEDRALAIHRAIQDAGEKTVVLVLGKGSEGRQRFGNLTYDCPTDSEMVRKEHEQLRPPDDSAEGVQESVKRVSGSGCWSEETPAAGFLYERRQAFPRFKCAEH